MTKKRTKNKSVVAKVSIQCKCTIVAPQCAVLDHEKHVAKYFGSTTLEFFWKGSFVMEVLAKIELWLQVRLLAKKAPVKRSCWRRNWSMVGSMPITQLLMIQTISKCSFRQLINVWSGNNIGDFFKCSFCPARREKKANIWAFTPKKRLEGVYDQKNEQKLKAWSPRSAYNVNALL